MAYFNNSRVCVVYWLIRSRIPIRSAVPIQLRERWIANLRQFVHYENSTHLFIQTLLHIK